MMSICRKKPSAAAKLKLQVHDMIRGAIESKYEGKGMEAEACRL